MDGRKKCSRSELFGIEIRVFVILQPLKPIIPLQTQPVVETT